MAIWNTPLHAAEYEEDVEAIRLLPERGADPSIPDDDGVLPAAYAQRVKRSDIVTLLRRRERNVVAP